VILPKDFIPESAMPNNDLITQLLQRGGIATASELAELTRIATSEKLREWNVAIRRETIDRPVKVITLSGDPPGWVEGYITQERFILDRTPDEMRDILGLRSADLTTGARVMTVTRTLTGSDFDNRGYTHLPGGKPWTGSGDYPPGKGAGQWALVRQIPARRIEDVKSGQRYRRGR
jgi:hypothetical protein